MSIGQAETYGRPWPNHQAACRTMLNPSESTTLINVVVKYDLLQEYSPACSMRHGNPPRCSLAYPNLGLRQMPGLECRVSVFLFQENQLLSTCLRLWFDLTSAQPDSVPDRAILQIRNVSYIVLFSPFPSIPNPRTVRRTMPWMRRQIRTLALHRTLLLVLCAFLFIDVVRFHDVHFRRRRVNAMPKSQNQRLFLASTHWNNEGVLKSHWNDQIVEIATHFGPENIFLSVRESGSWDDSKGALRELDSRLETLGVVRKIVLDPITHQDEISQPPADGGWVDTPRGTRELRRISYLSKLRNLSLQPLFELKVAGTTFDKVVFLNDVIFSMEDFLTLLETNDGNYAAACSLDFSKPPKYYDTFALRDSEGHEAIMQTWPYFRSWQSRKALKSNAPVPVTSCWNGMVIMDPAPFYDNSPLQFRGIPDSLAKYHLEASECCLIHQDNRITTSKGVWLNPAVAVGYNKAAYDAVKEGIVPSSILEYLKRAWENRIRRWLTTDWFKRRVVHSRTSRWRRDEKTTMEIGLDCLVNEMQVLVYNGWAHL